LSTLSRVIVPVFLWSLKTRTECFAGVPLGAWARTSKLLYEHTYTRGLWLSSSAIELIFEVVALVAAVSGVIFWEALPKKESIFGPRKWPLSFCEVAAMRRQLLLCILISTHCCTAYLNFASRSAVLLKIRRSAATEADEAWDTEDTEWLRARQRARGTVADAAEVEHWQSSRAAESNRAAQTANDEKDDAVDGDGVMRTTLLWALLHGPVAAAAVPALFLVGLTDKGGEGKEGGTFAGLRNVFGSLLGNNKAAAAAVQKPTGYTVATDTAASATDCACGSMRPYTACCAPLHTGAALPHNATALMRARYSALATGQPQFVMDTTARSSADWRDDSKAWRAELQAYCEEFYFVGLDVGPEKPVLLEHTNGSSETVSLIVTANLEKRAVSTNIPALVCDEHVDNTVCFIAQLYIHACNSLFLTDCMSLYAHFVYCIHCN
jgi:uncharacterized protein YchJ